MPGVAGRSGRRPKPTAQKALAGNPGKRKLNKDEPDFALVTNVDAPEWLCEHATRVWEMLVPELLRAKVLALTDMHNVEAFCSAYGNWRRAQESVIAHGIVVAGATGGPVKIRRSLPLTKRCARWSHSVRCWAWTRPAARGSSAATSRNQPTSSQPY